MPNSNIRLLLPISLFGAAASALWAQSPQTAIDNDQVRVLKVVDRPHAKGQPHEHKLNRVVVYLTDQDGSMTAPDGKTETAKHRAGEVSWGGPTKHQEQNLKETSFEAVVVEPKN